METAAEEAPEPMKTAAEGAPPAGPEPIQIDVKPLREEGEGVFEVTVTVHDRSAGSSVVRTSPKPFAYQE